MLATLVFLRIQPYRQHSLANWLANWRLEKLSPRIFGPYKVIRQVRPVAYELELPASSWVHPIFHVLLLRPAFKQTPARQPAPLPITYDWEIILSSVKTLSRRWVKETGIPTLGLLVQWKDRPFEEASWESFDFLASQFPSFRLEDKSSFYVGSYAIPISTLKNLLRKKWRAPDKEQMAENYACLIYMI